MDGYLLMWIGRKRGEFVGKGGRKVTVRRPSLK
jgi:hypothetical protein